MELRRDEKGRPIGLAWPERPPVAPEIIEKANRKGIGPSKYEYCNLGRGPHLLSETGRNRNDGTRYCTECAKDRKRKRRQQGR